MANVMTVRLNKGDSPNWGFRLQGGKDFGTPLIIQKVNGGSPAERAGLIAGDSVIRINNTDVFNLRHKDAQDVVVRAGNCFDITVQRGGSTWKPSVVPTGSYPTPSPVINNISPVTKTSLAAHHTENIGAIGTGHNVSAKPFAAQYNGTANGGPKLVNKQYNSPLKLYSEESIAETISAQSEVLSTGALGVNFKKNEKNYDAANSAVYRMLQEAEKEPRDHDHSDIDSGIDTRPNSGIAGLRHVQAPETKAPSSNPQLPPGQNICADCERLIVGVFVRIKDKNLHVECFKCATCGTSLKNVGYYNINNKLYCDIHAKLAARNNPPAPNLVPVTVPPGGRAPANAISAALSTHSLPSPSPLSPKTNSYAAPYQSSSNYSGPKPFSSVSAPVSAPLSPHNTFSRAPLSPLAPAPAPSYSPASSAGRSVQLIWPPVQEEPELPTACPLYFPPPSQVQAELLNKQLESDSGSEYDYYTSCVNDFDDFEMAYQQHSKMSVCSEEISNITGRKSALECVETISETLETQKLVESIIKNRPQSPPPANEDIQIKNPPMTVTKEVPVPNCPLGLSENLCCQRKSSCDLKRPTEFTPTSLQYPAKTPPPKLVENTVPQVWESPMVQAIRTDEPPEDTFKQIPTKRISTPLGIALSVAPKEPFVVPQTTLDPVPLPPETDPYFPPEHPITIDPKPEKPPKEESEFVKALKTAPERPFTPAGTPVTPVKKRKDSMDKYFQDLPKPQEKLSMRSALTTAPERPYTPLVAESMGMETSKTSDRKTSLVDKSHLLKPSNPVVLPPSFQMNIKEPKPPGYYNPMQLTCEESVKSEEETKTTDTVKTTTIQKQEIIPGNPGKEVVFVGEQNEASSNFAPMFQGFSCSFQNKTDHSQFSIEINTTPPVLTPKSQTPIVQAKSTESVPSSVGYTKTETITKEEREQKELSKKQEKREVKVERSSQNIEKQAEEIVYKKPLPLASTLHKPQGLPQYQVNISESAEADLLLMQKMEAAQQRLERQKQEEMYQQQQKIAQQQIISQQERQQNIKQESKNVAQTTMHNPSNPSSKTKPIITVNPDTNPIPANQMTFQPVVEERPPSMTFSPRPRPLTPSMINKPAPTLPYYQANLVAQQYQAPTTNLLDPTTPDVSRSPSPCPERRSPSPFATSRAKASAAARAKSPAEGPPPNPLKSNTPLPNPRDSRVEKAKENLSAFIPQYKSKRDVIEQTKGMDFYKRASDASEHQVSFQENPQIYTSQVQTQSKTYPQQQQTIQQRQQTQFGEKTVQGISGYEIQKHRVDELRRKEQQYSQCGDSLVSTSISEQGSLQQTDKLREMQSQSVERSADGLTQIQRKKKVTEEFEHTHKEHMMEIETKKYPFHDINVSALEDTSVSPMHTTNPQPISCPMSSTCPKAASSQHSVKFSEGCLMSSKCSSSTCKDSGQCQNPGQCSKSTCPQMNPTAQTGRKQSLPNTVLTAQSSQSPSCKLLTSDLQKPPNQPATKHVTAPGSSASQSVNKSNVPQSNAGSGGGRQAGAIGVAPRRGRGILNAAAIGGARIPLCGSCHKQIRGPFITALGRIWCPDHFICTTPSCRRPLQDLGFVEEQGQLYCEYCFEQYLAPPCSKCHSKIKGDCLKAIGKNFHPECFNCVYCGKLFGNSPFFLEDGQPYCENDWNELFTTKCFACGFPVEAGDRWVEALNNNYHSQCFNCTMCKKNLEGQSFFAKGGRPFCKNHAR